jgi:hypothetical protein
MSSGYELVESPFGSNNYKDSFFEDHEKVANAANKANDDRAHQSRGDKEQTAEKRTGSSHGHTSVSSFPIRGHAAVSVTPHSPDPVVPPDHSDDTVIPVGKAITAQALEERWKLKGKDLSQNLSEIMSGFEELVTVKGVHWNMNRILHDPQGALKTIIELDIICGYLLIDEELACLGISRGVFICCPSFSHHPLPQCAWDWAESNKGYSISPEFGSLENVAISDAFWSVLLQADRIYSDLDDPHKRKWPDWYEIYHEKALENGLFSGPTERNLSGDFDAERGNDQNSNAAKNTSDATDSEKKTSGASDSDGANSDSETSRTRGALEHVSAKQSQEPAPENVRFPKDHRRGNSGGNRTKSQEMRKRKDMPPTKQPAGSRLIPNKDSPAEASHGPNNRRCLLDAVNVFWPKERGSTLYDDMVSCMPATGDTSIEDLSRALRAHGIKITHVSGQYIKKGGAPYHLFREHKCRLLLAIKLTVHKRTTQHFVAWDGETIHDRPYSCRISAIKDRASSESSKLAFGKLYPRSQFSNWQIVRVFRVNSDATNSDSTTPLACGALGHVTAQQSQGPATDISGASDSDGANSDSETSRTRGALEHVSAKQSQEPAPENVRKGFTRARDLTDTWRTGTCFCEAVTGTGA